MYIFDFQNQVSKPVLYKWQKHTFQTQTKAIFWFTLVDRFNMLFSKILIVLFSIKTCIGVVPRIVGGNEVSHKKQGKGWCDEIETGLNIIIAVIQKV